MKRNSYRLFFVCRLRRSLSFVLVAACSGQVWALELDPLCKLDPHAMIEQERVDDASDLWSPAIAFTRVQVQGMPEVYAASDELSVNFPQSGSRLQFFYKKASDNNDGPTLVGACATPIPTGRRASVVRISRAKVVGRLQLRICTQRSWTRGWGRPCFLAVKWPARLSAIGTEGWFYDTHAFGMLEASADLDWNELLDLEKENRRSQWSGWYARRQVGYLSLQGPEEPDQTSACARLSSMSIVKLLLFSVACEVMPWSWPGARRSYHAVGGRRIQSGRPGWPACNEGFLGSLFVRQDVEPPTASTIDASKVFREIQP